MTSPPIRLRPFRRVSPENEPLQIHEPIEALFDSRKKPRTNKGNQTRDNGPATIVSATPAWEEKAGQDVQQYDGSCFRPEC